MKPAPYPDFNDDEREIDRLEPAWADFLFGVRDGLRVMRDTDAEEKVRTRSLLDVHEALEGHRRRFEDGHPEALLNGLAVALEENVPVPYWISVEFCARLRSVMGMTSTAPVSLHTAFELDDVIPTTAKRYAKARADLRLEWKLWVEVERAKATGVSFDAALRQVIKNKSIGKTAARNLFLRRDAIQKALMKKGIRRHKAR
jgi:hypothetical protein